MYRAANVQQTSSFWAQCVEGKKKKTLFVAQKPALKLHQRITEDRFRDKRGRKLGTLRNSSCARWLLKRCEIEAFCRTCRVRKLKRSFRLLFLPLGMTSEGRSSWGWFLHMYNVKRDDLACTLSFNKDGCFFFFFCVEMLQGLVLNCRHTGLVGFPSSDLSFSRPRGVKNKYISSNL